MFKWLIVNVHNSDWQLVLITEWKLAESKHFNSGLVLYPEGSRTFFWHKEDP